MEWSGKSKGGAAGYKFFVQTLRLIGLRGAYFLAFWPALYFFFFAGKARKAGLFYLKEIQGYSSWKAPFSLFRSFYIFGKTLLDKVTLLAGLKHNFEFSFDGNSNIQEAADKGEGIILISAHVGNFEVAGRFLNHLNRKINVVTVDNEAKEIKAYLDSLDHHPQELNFIYLSQDLSHILEIASAVTRNEVVCFTGDRFLPGAKTFEGNFMGRKAHFSSGPFEIAARLKVPVGFVACMKESNRKYSFYGKIFPGNDGKAEDIFNFYLIHLETILRTYPLQWFNYYPFWS